MRLVILTLAAAVALALAPVAAARGDQPRLVCAYHQGATNPRTGAPTTYRVCHRFG